VEGLIKRTMENLKARIVSQAASLPDEIRLKDLRKTYVTLKSDVSFTDFLEIFQSCTGYLLSGGKLKRVLRYRDPLLCSVAYEIYKKGLNIPSEEEGVLIYKIPTTDILDFRRILASMITSTLLYSMPFKSKRSPEGLVPMELDTRIAKAIRDSPRWEAPRLAGMLGKLRERSFAALSEHEFNLLNVAEARAIGVIAWHASWRRNKQNFEKIFSRFLRQVGVDDVIKYGKAVVYPAKVETNPEQYCLSEFNIEDVKRYAKQRGIRFEKLALTHERLRNLHLCELECDFVPIFFERKSTFQADFRLLDTNDLGVLCYSIPEARSAIIDGAYKGRVFEQFLLDLLTGNIAVESTPSEWHAASFYLLDMRERPIPERNIILYTYRPPKRFLGMRLKRDRSSVAFRPFLEAESLQEFDIDLLLIHNDYPEHILVGECKFTKRYNDELYRECESKVVKLAKFVENSQDARSELGLPLDFKVLPALFTSYSGPALAQSSPAIKSTLHTTTSGLFKFWVTQALS